VPAPFCSLRFIAERVSALAEDAILTPVYGHGILRVFNFAVKVYLLMGYRPFPGSLFALVLQYVAALYPNLVVPGASNAVTAEAVVHQVGRAVTCCRNNTQG
jgi:hypothetical protein